jgi:tetratricopeptide (TPR) repeat protein
MEVSAAALCASGTSNGTALNVLKEAKGRQDLDPVALHHALAEAALQAKQPEAALREMESLERTHPGSAASRELNLRALWSLKRWSDYESLVRSSLLDHRDASAARSDLLWRLGAAQSRAGRIKQALATLQGCVDQGQATASIYNSSAWYALFVEPHPATMLPYALKAAQLSSSSSYSMLHTLAAVYIELGMVEETRQTLAKLLELRGHRGPGSATFYIVGALAEAYGLPETARSAYRKVEPDDDSGPIATYVLAQRRLARLQVRH